ncbi:TetR family transcriptional regulator [Actinoallomurus acanthiterrae]
MISDPEESAVTDEARTPRQERRAQTRAALLDAAERLWAERGIRGASLDEIAARAGLTKGAVYSNFASKSDLVLALLERYTQADPGLGALTDLRGSERSPDERRAAAGRHYAERLSDEETRMRALLLVELWLFGMRDFSAGWRIADWYHARREELAADLAAGSSEMSPEDRASLAMAIEFGLALQHLLDPERVPAELYGSGVGLLMGPPADDATPGP